MQILRPFQSKRVNEAKEKSRGQISFEKAKFELFGRENGQLATLCLSNYGLMLCLGLGKL